MSQDILDPHRSRRDDHHLNRRRTRKNSITAPCTPRWPMRWSAADDAAVRVVRDSGPRDDLQRRQRHRRLPEQAARRRRTRRCSASCAASRAFPSRWSPPSAARRWASAPRCCCTATWSMPATTLRSRCPSSTSACAPRRRPACWCRRCRLPPRRRGAAAGRALHGRGGARGRPGQPRRAADRGERVAHAQARKLAAKPMTALVETKRLLKKRPGGGARTHRGGSAQLPPHDAGTGGARGVRGLHGKAQAGFRGAVRTAVGARPTSGEIRPGRARGRP